MLSILILLVAMIVLGIWLYNILDESVGGIIIFCLIAFLLVSLPIATIPFAGYNEEPIIEDTTLIPIIEGEEANCYLINTEEHYYTFKTSNSINKYGVAESHMETMVGTNIQYIEEDDRSVAVLKKYTYTPKRNLWTLGLLSERTEYVFMLPIGSVIK